MGDTQQTTTQPTIIQPLSVKKQAYYRRILLFVLLLIISGVGGYVIGTGNKQEIPTKNSPYSDKSLTNAASPTPYTEPSKTSFADTVDYATGSDGQVYLRYKGDITLPDNPFYRTVPSNLIWTPLVHAPSTPDEAHRVVFSLQQMNGQIYEFMFVMEWDITHYDLYIHKKDGSTEKLMAFDITDKSNEGYNVPKINEISNDGNYVALDMYGCWYCEAGQPSVLLINIQSKKVEKIGRVAYFNWKNNGVYEYKEYVTKTCPSPSPGEVQFTNICPEDPHNIPLKTGIFQ